jgi:hypothetical protein
MLCTKCGITVNDLGCGCVRESCTLALGGCIVYRVFKTRSLDYTAWLLMDTRLFCYLMRPWLALALDYDPPTPQSPHAIY